MTFYTKILPPTTASSSRRESAFAKEAARGAFRKDYIAERDRGFRDRKPSDRLPVGDNGNLDAARRAFDNRYNGGA